MSTKHRAIMQLLPSETADRRRIAAQIQGGKQRGGALDPGGHRAGLDLPTQGADEQVPEGDTIAHRLELRPLEESIRKINRRSHIHTFAYLCLWSILILIDLCS